MQIFLSWTIALWGHDIFITIPSICISHQTPFNPLCPNGLNGVFISNSFILATAGDNGSPIPCLFLGGTASNSLSSVLILLDPIDQQVSHTPAGYV